MSDDIWDEPTYDPDEVALARALRRDLGEQTFNATLNAHPDAPHWRGDDGIYRVRFGEVEFWLDEDGMTCWGIAVGTDLHTGYVANGDLHFDPPLRVFHPELN